MGLIIPVRGTMYHAFSVNDQPSSAGIARSLAAGSPILPPIAAPARRTLRTLLGLPADAAPCLACPLAGHREHSKSNDPTHYVSPLGGIA